MKTMRRSLDNNSESTEAANQAILGHATFAAGYVTRYLEDYARSREISSFTLAVGVAELIRASAGGEVLRAEDHMPRLRRDTTERSSPARSLALAGGARGDKASLNGNGTGKRKARVDNTLTPWKDTEDSAILRAVKEAGKVGAPEISRELMKHLKDRTEGAIRQRIARLIRSGQLKSKMSRKSDGGIPHLLLEAA